MKAGLAHSVPLVPEALAILATLPKTAKPFDLSENAMLALIQKRMGYTFTTHGMRAAFSSWAHSTYPELDQVIEFQLAHVMGKVKAAYQRDGLLDARRKLLENWAAFLNGK
jgi:integrase